jgi:hypothetical protein
MAPSLRDAVASTSPRPALERDTPHVKLRSSAASIAATIGDAAQPVTPAKQTLITSPTLARAQRLWGRLVRMDITPGPGEPAATPWRTVRFSQFTQEVFGAALDAASTSRFVVAIDGRSGAGKSTLAGRLASSLPNACVVATDDICWNESRFAWSHLAVEGVLGPFANGETVSYRPPAWEAHGRRGAIEIPASSTILLLEGVGAGRRELTYLIDVLIWVQSDFAEAERRGIARDIAAGVNGDPLQTTEFWHAWIAEEVPFLQLDRPWERASVIVAGTSQLPVSPDKITASRVTATKR